MTPDARGRIFNSRHAGIRGVLSSHAVGLKATLATVRGNSRILLLTTLVCWIVQFAFLNTYLPIFLTSPGIGVSKEMYGVLCSVTSLMVMIGGFVSGWLAARFKAKWVLMCGDLTGFSLTSVCWLAGSAGRPFFFVLAAVLGSAWAFHNACFQLLLTQDRDRESLPGLYAFFSITTLGVGFLTPVAGSLLERIDLVTLTRAALVCNAALVACGALIRIIFLKPYVPAHAVAKDGKPGLGEIFRVLKSSDRALSWLFVVAFLQGWCGVARSSYANIYFTDGLGVSKSAISVLPAVTSVAIIAGTLVSTPLLKSSSANLLLRLAFAFLVCSDVALAAAPQRCFPWLIPTVVVSGLGVFMVSTLMTSTIMNLSRRQHWPHVVGFNVPVFSLAGILSGFATGWLYGIWPRLPYAVSACVAFAAFVIVMRNDFSPRHAEVPLPADTAPT